MQRVFLATPLMPELFFPLRLRLGETFQSHLVKFIWIACAETQFRASSARLWRLRHCFIIHSSPTYFMRLPSRLKLRNFSFHNPHSRTGKLLCVYVCEEEEVDQVCSFFSPSRSAKLGIINFTSERIFHPAIMFSRVERRRRHWMHERCKFAVVFVFVVVVVAFLKKKLFIVERVVVDAFYARHELLRTLCARQKATTLLLLLL